MVSRAGVRGHAILDVEPVRRVAALRAIPHRFECTLEVATKPFGVEERMGEPILREGASNRGERVGVARERNRQLFVCRDARRNQLRQSDRGQRK